MTGVKAAAPFMPCNIFCGHLGIPSSLTVSTGGPRKKPCQFQKAHGLVASGEMNKPAWEAPAWEALVVPVKQGSSGLAVTAAQLRLQAAGFAVPLTGRFDAPTKTAVLKFQAQSGHTADVIVGPSTWSALIEGQDEGDTD